MGSPNPGVTVSRQRRTRGGSTKERARRGPPDELLLTAERLIAANGVDTVSLRQIASEAGCRNPSVVQYHFGDRVGLLRAIVEFRTPFIDRRLRELLEQLVEEGRQDDIRGIVEAMARPLLELDRESLYLPFLARLYVQPEMDSTDLSMIGSVTSLPLLQSCLEVALAHLPPEVRAQRERMAADLAVTTLANRRLREGSGAYPTLTDEQRAQGLFDAMAGLMDAPHTGG